MTASSRLSPPALGLAVVSTVALAVLSGAALDGWHPHDEGTLAHAAERMLSGELPHRDFDAVYTGGLEWLHAQAFRLFGTSLVSLRLVLLLVSLAAVPVTYWVALRFLPPLGATAITLASLVWGVPTYFAGLPSWYVTFCGLFAGASLLRFLDVRRRRWLFIAGLFGGFAFLMKVVGLFVVVASALFLVRLAQVESRTEGAERHRSTSWAVTAGGLLVPLALALLVRKHLDFMGFVHFVWPGTALAAFVVGDEWRQGRGRLGERLRGLVTLAWPLLLGAALPVVLFLVPYATSDSLGAFWFGVFVLPQRRITSASASLPTAWTLVAALPAALLLLLPDRLRALPWKPLLAGVSALLLALLAFGDASGVYLGVWYGLRPLMPIVALAVLLDRTQAASDGLPRFLFASLAAFVSLMQYPFPFGIYFCYVAPLVLLALAAVADRQAGTPRAMQAVFLVFFGLFGAAWVGPGRLIHVGRSFVLEPPHATLSLPRGGLDIPADEAEIYNALIQGIQVVAPPGSAIYAANDCPQVYFLADRKNPTRTLYDFLDPDFGVDSKGRRERLLRLLEASDVKAVVLHDGGEFSGPVHPRLAADLAARYPRSERYGYITLRWRP